MAHVTSALAEIVATSPEAGRAVVLGPGVMEGLLQVLKGGCLMPQLSPNKTPDDAPDRSALFSPLGGAVSEMGVASHRLSPAISCGRRRGAPKSSRLGDADVRHETARRPRTLRAGGERPASFVARVHLLGLLQSHAALHRLARRALPPPVISAHASPRRRPEVAEPRRRGAGPLERRRGRGEANTLRRGAAEQTARRFAHRTPSSSAWMSGP
jgi:hypothetical protein